MDAELIKAAKVADHSYQFHVPKRLETLTAFNQALLSTFPMMAKVELDKSKANDWNDQLKEQLKAPAQSVALAKEPGQLPPTPEQDAPRRRGPRR